MSAAVLAGIVLVIVDQEFRDQIVQFANADIAAVKDGYRTDGEAEAREVIEQRMAAPGASDFFLLQRDGRRGWRAIWRPCRRRPASLTLPCPGGAGACHPGRRRLSSRPIFMSFPAATSTTRGWRAQRILRMLVWVFAGAAAAGDPGRRCWSAAASCSRTDAIARACRAIMDGNLKTRIPVRGTQDELDRLSETINAMLDRIAALMENLRQVTNDIAHDLRTPVTHLRHRLERARAAVQHRGDYDQALEAAIAASDEILALFAALLRIAQIEGGARRAGFRAARAGRLAAPAARNVRAGGRRCRPSPELCR